jgi:hypothetical protein
MNFDQWFEETGRFLLAGSSFKDAMEGAFTAGISPTQGADARPVAITDEVLYKLWALALDSTEHEFKAAAPALLDTRGAAPSDGPEFRATVTDLVSDMLTAWIADLPISACGEISARVNALLAARDAIAPMEKT